MPEQVGVNEYYVSEEEQKEQAKESGLVAVTYAPQPNKQGRDGGPQNITNVGVFIPFVTRYVTEDQALEVQRTGNDAFVIGKKGESKAIHSKAIQSKEMKVAKAIAQIETEAEEKKDEAIEKVAAKEAKK